MSIINNFSGYSFEQAIDLIAQHVRRGDRDVVLTTEIGDILLDTSVVLHTIKPVEVYSWGNEPSTPSVINHRHELIDFYVQVNMPVSMRHKRDFCQLMGVVAMSNIFISLIRKEKLPVYDESVEEVRDLAIQRYNAYHSCGYMCDLHGYITMQHSRGLTSIFESTRRATDRLINEVTKRRSERASDIAAELQEDRPDAAGHFFRGYWWAMFQVAQYAYSFRRPWMDSRADKLTVEDVEAYFTAHPGEHMTPCQAIIIMVTGGKFIHKEPEEPKKLENATARQRSNRRKGGSKGQTQDKSQTEQE